MSTTNDLTQAAKERFLDVNRDLLALTKNGAIDIFRRISASLALNSQAQDDVMSVVSASDGTNLLDQKGFAGQSARDDFSREIYKAICQSFLRIQRNCVIEFVAKLTPEALEQLEDIEIVAGQRAPRAVVPPPPPPLTAAEQLEAEVRRDWVHLRTSEVKRKCNNAAYRAVFDKLMNAGQLESFCTSLHAGGREFRS
jgi:ParB-like chromosome segregation protein Spo0J